MKPATKDDLDLLVLWARQFHYVSMLKEYDFSAQGTRNFLSMMIDSPDCLVLIHDTGALGAIIHDYPFCNVRVAKELFWYAERDGIKLLAGFGEWAIEKGADLQMMSSLQVSDKNTERMRRVMSRYGYLHVENTYLKRA